MTAIFAVMSCKTSSPIVLNGEYSVEKVLEVPGKPEAFVLFNDTTGLLSANMGCNMINANYKLLEDNKLEIQNGLSTKMMCPDNELENTFNQILEGTTHYEMDGEMLMLFSNGEMQAVLKQVK